MKHTWQITLILLLFFLIAQFIGLAVTAEYIIDDDLPLGIERPEIEESTSFIPVFVFILVATVLVLVLLKFKLFRLWKFWFLLSVFFCLTVSFNAFIAQMYAIGLAIVLAIWKVLKPNMYVHNFTELFVYGALAAIFAPMFNVFSIVLLLILISVYDYIAVFKTKHMVTMAKSQEKANVFAGLYIPYGKNVAILGGGDIGFPLLFGGVVMHQFSLGLLSWQLYLIPLGAALGLMTLFLIGDKKKFYPAMPFVTIGCFVGLALVYLF